MGDDDVNPYASPAGDELTIVAYPLKQLRGPSFGLLLLSVTWGGIGCLGLVVTAGILVWTRATDVRAFEFFVRSVSINDVTQLLSMFVSWYIAFGAWCMRRGTCYKKALFAAVLASIPLASPWIFIGIPIGVWALLVLRRPAVRAAFAANELFRLPPLQTQLEMDRHHRAQS